MSYLKTICPTIVLMGAVDNISFRRKKGLILEEKKLSSVVGTYLSLSHMTELSQ